MTYNQYVICRFMVDLTELLATSAASAFVTMCLMYCFYRLWILPYLTDISFSIPSSVKELVFPYVDDMKNSMIADIETRVGDLTKTVKSTSARFQRTVNQAAAALDLDDIDIMTEEGQQEAKEKLTRSYGADVAVQAITQLIQTINQGRKKPEEKKEGAIKW